MTFTHVIVFCGHNIAYVFEDVRNGAPLIRFAGWQRQRFDAVAGFGVLCSGIAGGACATCLTIGPYAERGGWLGAN